MLLISEQVLDTRAYNEESKVITWENCSLRKWLNSEFIDEAFSDEERSKILDTKVTADRDTFYSGDPGNDTIDKVFLLSVKEAK